VKLLEQLVFVTITIPKDNNGFVGKSCQVLGKNHHDMGIHEQAKKFPSNQIGIMKLNYIQT
jgi:hypothetical protein